ncbi:MAG TPA: high-affinity branched-chain amino acid ABC transporter permease LivM [Candidatus Sulfotelmatobacter sp.]|jgi:branched-chain amino acid transport system permease protein|nr:high-affinity branched-chain amino acid ABC transporter permease LivM [Candidatus Sulfotelmatobacter sp.]
MTTTSAAAGHHHHPSLSHMVKDSIAAGLLAALLALPLLGFHLLDSAQGLHLDYRFSLVLWSGVIVFAGRLGLSLAGAALGRRMRASGKAAVEAADASAAPGKGGKIRKIAGWIMVATALVLPLLPFSDRNLIDKATLLLIYVMLGWGLNIVVGLAGLLDLGYVAFYAVGAYSYALLSQHFGLNFWICLPLAGLLSASFGMALGFPVLRLRGDYLAIVTLGFGEIIRVVLLNWQDFTGGPNGIAGIKRPSFFGLPFTAVSTDGSPTFAQFFGLDFSADHRIVFLYYLILVLALATNLFTLRIRKLPIGRAWEALREDETACRSLGINPTKTKLSAFAIGAMFAGFAGSFFATRQGFISPESFTFIESAIILAIVVLGGMGSQIGIVLAAVLLVGLPEWFRDLQLYRMLAFGGAMVLIMLWRPRGLLSSREPTIRLGDLQEAGE